MRADVYAGVIAPWKVRLVTSRAKRRGVRGADLDEVVRRILIQLLDFEYCESRSNGATEATAITALVDRQIAYYRRGDARHRPSCDAAPLPNEPTIDNRQTLVAGKIPQPIRVGRSTLWRYLELRAWVNAGCPDRETWETWQCLPVREPLPPTRLQSSAPHGSL